MIKSMNLNHKKSQTIKSMNLNNQKITKDQIYEFES